MKTLATRKSDKIPLPPSNSLPIAAVSLAFKLIHDWGHKTASWLLARKHNSFSPNIPQNFAVNHTFAKLAWPGVIVPFSYNLQRRQPTSTIAWTLPSMRTSFCWLIWKAASGAPNCFLSFRYLWISYESVMIVWEVKIKWYSWEWGCTVITCDTCHRPPLICQ